nr:4-oxalocrotonate tautomerase family protein [uncultured Rhodoferax sp.]
MPIVNLQLIAGLSLDQKRTLVAEITQTLSRVIGAKPERTHILIQEVADEDWGLEGRLVLDRRAQQPKA